MKQLSPQTVYPAGSNPVIFDFSLPIGRYHKNLVFLNKWWIADGDLVKSGEFICLINLGYRGSFTQCHVTAKEEGYIQHLLKPGEQLFENKPIAIIHAPGSYSKENSPSNPTFKYHFTPFRYQYLSKRHIRFKPQLSTYPPEAVGLCDWKKKDAEWVEKGEAIFTVTRFYLPKCYFDFKGDPVDHLAEKSGLLQSIHKSETFSKLDPLKLVYMIHDDISLWKKRR